MAYQISDDCISCGVCASNCPVNAISEGDGKYVIDADTCIECGACAENCGRIRFGRMRPFCTHGKLRKGCPRVYSFEVLRTMAEMQAGSALF